MKDGVFKVKLQRGLFSTVIISSLLVGSPFPLMAENTEAKSIAQASIIKGQVVDVNGVPVIGASILVKGTTDGTITDIDGFFQLNNAKGTLVISYIGYKTQEIEIKGRTDFKIVLKEDSEILDEVVVVGYGTQKKESLTGAVTVVDSKAFVEKGSMSSPLQALQGQVPGVMITRSSAAPGDESWGLSLRGSVSVNSTSPLIIIDGVAYSSANDLRLLNSNDIESINFLKDGAAAIYGSRAAGGVVLVTTKKGKEGKVKVDYSGSATVKTVGLMPEMMNIDQWADGLMQAYDNDNKTHDKFYSYAQFAKQFKGYYILNNPDTYFLGFTDVSEFVFDDSVDWLGSLFGSAFSTDHNLSISGGTDKSSYRISLGYMYDGSTLQYGENNNKRYNFRMNNTYKFTKNLKLDSSISYNRQEQITPSRISSALSAGLLQPGLPLTTIDGKPYMWGSNEGNASPVGKITDGGDNTLSVSAISISETLNYTPTEWLTANVNVGYNTSQVQRNVTENSITYYNYLGTEQQETWPTPENSYYRSTTSRTDFYSVSGYLNAHKAFVKHDLSLTLGTQYEFNEYYTWGIKVKNNQPGLDIVNGSGEITVDGANNNKTDKYQYSLLSFFGRFNYDFGGKYLVELQGRYDGSSKFLPENRWNFFWGGSVGWRIKQESFLEDTEWLHDLKLRLSYAEVGNQSGIGNYDGVQLYNLSSSTGAYVGNEKLSYIATSGTLASTTRTWERIKNYNVGLDFAFIGGKLSGNIDAFLKRNDNMLVQITYPGILGDKAPSSNSGKFKDYGFDGQFTWRDKIGDIDYHIGGTFSFARNELVDFGGTTVLSSGYVSTQQGYPLNSIFGLRYGGKIQNEEQLKAYLDKYYDNNGIGMPSNLRVGDNMYCDENGDGILDEKDYIYLGGDTPEISYSFNIGASYHGFDLSLIFQGVANRFIYRSDGNWTQPFRATYQNSTTASIGNTWSVNNPDAYYAPYSTDRGINDYNYQASSITAQDGRYLRLKNVTLGYNFPDSMMKRTKVISSARIYVTGSDLWETCRIHDGWDPESKRNATGTARYPFTRNITFGVNLSF